jgi:hypothetical protein
MSGKTMAVQVNQNQRCEPQLGRPRLYRATGGERDRAVFEQALPWVLTRTTASFVRSGERSHLSFRTVRRAGDAWIAKRLDPRVKVHAMASELSIPATHVILGHRRYAYRLCERIDYPFRDCATAPKPRNGQQSWCA